MVPRKQGCASGVKQRGTSSASVERLQCYPDVTYFCLSSPQPSFLVGTGRSDNGNMSLFLPQWGKEHLVNKDGFYYLYQRFHLTNLNSSKQYFLKGVGEFFAVTTATKTITLSNQEMWYWNFVQLNRLHCKKKASILLTLNRSNSSTGLILCPGGEQLTHNNLVLGQLERKSLYLSALKKGHTLGQGYFTLKKLGMFQMWQRRHCPVHTLINSITFH